MATAGSNKGRARFAAACGVLSRYVKEAAEKAAAETEARPEAMVALPLMPGADLSTTTQEKQEPATCCALQLQSSQMTIFYGGRVMVLDDIPADKAASLLQIASTAAARGAKKTVGPIATTDLPVAKKASLQRFMEKRKIRVAARAAPPYLRPDDGARSRSACPDRLALAL